MNVINVRKREMNTATDILYDTDSLRMPNEVISIFQLLGSKGYYTNQYTIEFESDHADVKYPIDCADINELSDILWKINYGDVSCITFEGATLEEKFHGAAYRESGVVRLSFPKKKDSVLDNESKTR